MYPYLFLWLLYISASKFVLLESYIVSFVICNIISCEVSNSVFRVLLGQDKKPPRALPFDIK